MKFNEPLVRGQAVQDQEIARGVAWLEGSDPRTVKKFWDAINDSDIHAVRQMSAEHLQVLCAVACVGFFEVSKASQEG